MVNRLLAVLFYLLYTFIFISADQTSDIKRIGFLSETTDYRDNYSVVKQNCNEIIRLSSKIGRADYMLIGYYTLCWSAENYGEIEDLHNYVVDGMKILTENYNELIASDTGRMIMANMIHASGTYNYAMGNFDRTIEEFLKIVPPDSDPLTQNSDILFAVYNYLGQSYFNIGLLDKSIRYFDLARRYNQSPEDFAYSEALYLMYKAQYEHSTGEIENAFSSLKNAIRVLENDPRKLYVRRDLKSLYLLNASYYGTENKYDSAIYFTRKSMRLFSENDPNYINGFRLLGDIYYNDAKPDSALFYYNKSIEYSDRIFSDVHPSKARSYCGIGNVYRSKRNFETAHQFYQKAGKNAFSSLEIMNVKIETARLYNEWYSQSRAIKDLDSGLVLLESALYLNDLSRREQFNHESKESRSELQSEIAGLGTEIAWKGFESTGMQEYIEKCFHFMEKNKANILLDKVYEINARKFSGIPGDVLEKETRLRGELSYLQSHLNYDRNKDDISDLIRYDDKQLEYINLISDIEKRYPEYYNLKYARESVTIEQVQEVVKGTGEMIIMYYTANDRIYIAGVSESKAVLKLIDKDGSFNNSFSQYTGQMNVDKVSEMARDATMLNSFIRSSRYLYRQLIEPVIRESGGKINKLTIVPDGQLCYLPFEALLISSAEKPVNYGDLPYLIKEYPVSYEYSASMLMKRTDKAENRRLRYLGFAPEYESGHLNRPDLGNVLVPLISGRDEIELCSDVWKGSSFIGNQATDVNFTANANKYNIIHLALHTIINDDDSRLSCMIFSPSHTENDEGLLYISDLYNMELNSELIMLSGCETGTGSFKYGEGIISLARAFRYAGCRSLLMSLWKINDKSSREVMVQFNRNLKKGMDKAEALREAKLDYIENSAIAHPAYWAGFVITGDSKPLKHRFRFPVVVIGVILVAGLVVVLVRKSLQGTEL